jgi:hypothetical protein
MGRAITIAMALLGMMFATPTKATWLGQIYDHGFGKKVHIAMTMSNGIALGVRCDAGVRVKPWTALTPAQRQLVTAVKQTRGQYVSIEIKLADRMRAVESRARHIGFF